MAFSRQLSVAALSLMDTELEKAALLAAESYCSADTGEARHALLTHIQTRMQNRVALIPPPIDAGSAVHVVAYSPDGKYVAWGAEQAPVRWQNVETGDTSQDAFEVRAGAVHALGFSPDSSWLVSGGYDGYLVVRNLLTGEVKKSDKLTIVYHSLDINKQGQLALAAGKQVWLFDLPALWEALPDVPENVLLEHDGDIFSLAWDRTGTLLATGSRDQTVRITNVAQNTIVPLPRLHTKPVREVAWSPDGTRLASAGDDGRINIWDPQTGQRIGNPLLEPNGRAIYGLSFNSDGHWLASGGLSDDILIWDETSRQIVARETQHFSDNISSLDFSPVKSGGSDRLVGGSTSGQVSQFSVSVFQQLAGAMPDLPTDAPLAALNVNPDGSLLALAGTGEQTQLFRLEEDGDAWQALGAALPASSAVAITLDGEQLAYSPLGQPPGPQSAIVLGIADSSSTNMSYPLAGELTSPLFSLAFDATAATLAASQCVLNAADSPTCDPDQAHLQFQAVAGETGLINKLTGLSDRPLLLAYDPLGRWLASADVQWEVQVWELYAESQIPEYQYPLAQLQLGQPPTALAFSRDGRVLAVANQDWTLQLWDTARWQKIGAPLTGSPAKITALAFDSFGEILFAVGETGVVQQWNVDALDWATQACASTNRIFSYAEWSLYFGSELFNPACQRLNECRSTP